MPKYNIGDIVKVRPDLEIGKKYHSCDGIRYAYFVDDMSKYLGSVVLITDVDCNFHYRINNDGGRFFWTDEMFMPYNDINPIDIGSMI